METWWAGLKDGDKVLGKLGPGSGDSIKIFSILKFYLCKQLRKALVEIDPVQ